VWREQNPDVKPDLSKARLVGEPLDEVNLRRANLGGANLKEARLHGANLVEAKLKGAKLEGADLSEANLIQADLNAANLRDSYLGSAVIIGANLRGADLSEADLSWADVRQVSLSKAKLIGANLEGADFYGADLSGAELTGADLFGAILIRTNLEGANLTGCFVYGISAWDIRLEGATQSNLVITPPGESPIQVDNLEVAQFIYLLLNNEKIRSVIDTITSKVVLILGRFTPDRKAVLDAIRDELRRPEHGYLPVLFDFQKPANRSLTGTISTLANMARFIIVDLTDPSCVPYELATIVPATHVPLQPLIVEGQHQFGMFGDLLEYPWVLEPHHYGSKELLIAHFGEQVIAPAEAKLKELTLTRQK